MSTNITDVNIFWSCYVALWRKKCVVTWQHDAAWRKVHL